LPKPVERFGTLRSHRRAAAAAIPYHASVPHPHLPLRKTLLPLAVVLLAGVLVSQATALIALAGPSGNGVPSPSAAEQVVALRSGGFTLEELSGKPPVAPAKPLPTPVDPPKDPYAPEPEVVLGTIEIPRLGLDLPLNQGISLNSIDRGPSHWPGTALPGDPGNVVIAGHRVTATAPFRDIDQLEPGDAVVFTVGDRRSTYRVVGHEVVTPDAMRIVEQTPQPTATLFACHPPGSAKYRYVVSLVLDDVVDLTSSPRFIGA
jgi:LPXTG-site transpeptidase (sortase) family protein